MSIPSQVGRPRMKVLRQRLIVWDGPEPEDAKFYPDPSRHPKCVAIKEKVGEGAVRTIYERGNQVWL